MLRGVVGDEIFFDIFKAWYNNPKTQYGTAYTKDFQDVCEQVSGMNLEKFFQQWIYGQNYPEYKLKYSIIENSNDYTVDVTLEQAQEYPRLFWMPLQLRIVTEDGNKNFTIWDSLENQNFSFTVSAKPTEVILDPDNWVLKKMKKTFTNPTLDQGILLVNGMKWNQSIKEAYQAKAFWGDAKITFWDIFDEPAIGYPETLPAPIGHGELYEQLIGNYSTVIWLGNYDDDQSIWRNLLQEEYLDLGGNLVLISRLGYAYLEGFLTDYSGINWAQSINQIASNNTAVYPGLVSMDLLESHSEISLIDTVTNYDNSKILFKSDVNTGAIYGSGIWRKPEDKGSFIYLAGKPWLYNHSQLKENMTFILMELAGENINGIDDIYESVIPDNFEITNVYPNPFNPSTTIDFNMPNAGTVSIAVFDILGKKVVFHSFLLYNKN
jgi:hypothetical protein